VGFFHHRRILGTGFWRSAKSSIDIRSVAVAVVVVVVVVGAVVDDNDVAVAVLATVVPFTVVIINSGDTGGDGEREVLSLATATGTK
jgi:hypothetical protein